MRYQNQRFLKLFGWVVAAAFIFTILPRFVFASLMFSAQILFWFALFYFLYRMFGRRLLSDYTRNRRYKKDKPPSYYSDRR